jgi:hypothetical protein
MPVKYCPESAPSLKEFTKIGMYLNPDNDRYVITWKKGNVLCITEWDGLSVDFNRVDYRVLLEEL